MAKKIYYTEQEAAAKLGVPVDQLQNKFVREGKLRAFQDGPRKMYKTEEVDALCGESEIELSPVDTGTQDAVAITDSDKKPGKEDTVITAEGISIFDDEDLEIEAADPMAKTQITPSLEDQISAEGVGSGSGLLDLTRESDDTSLGAEVLDHIDIEGTVGSDLGGDTTATAAVTYPQQGESYLGEPAVVESADPAAHAFGGLAVGAAILMLLIAGTALALVTESLPGYVATLSENMPIFLAVAVVFCGICAAVGFFVGKAMSASRKAM